MTTASTARLDDRGGDRARVGDVEVGARERDDLVAVASRGAHDVLAEHPAGAGDEDSHPYRMPISELSPTMKR